MNYVGRGIRPFNRSAFGSDFALAPLMHICASHP
jgi:hypothetical protein